ncbi:MAG: hypothetical protein JRJ44_06860 [Deltaproteobacteria bacterium]|nr:hypothetical protein [Deltaproteobacteria bacterium]
MSKEMITVSTITYSLTDKGKQSFKQVTQRRLFGKWTAEGFYAATYKVDEIINFSEPSQSNGYTISNVNFSVTPHKVADWTKNQAIIDAFPDLPKKLEENQRRSATLILMNNGWVHETEIEK